MVLTWESPSFFLSSSIVLSYELNKNRVILYYELDNMALYSFYGGNGGCSGISHASYKYKED